jgi:signal transduction histidine kinase
VVRYGPDAPVATVGSWNSGRIAGPSAGSGWLLEKGTAAELVARTKTLGRIGVAEGTASVGELPTSLRNIGITPAVGCPVTIGGHLWGALVVGSRAEPLPEDTGRRMLDFTELPATAITNADSQAKLQASRARVLGAADATRRLIERDIHHGTQQRLISLMLELRSTTTAPPADPEELRGRLSEMTESLGQAVGDLQEIARGLHPALLSWWGLQPAIKALARCRTVPVELNVCADRLPECYEITVYHVVAEALTNAAEHADASVVHVGVSIDGATIRVRIRDDGKGGADPGRGSGLLNITDRVEALGGRLQITSRVGDGTSLLAEIPITEAG